MQIFESKNELGQLSCTQEYTMITISHCKGRLPALHTTDGMGGIRNHRAQPVAMMGHELLYFFLVLLVEGPVRVVPKIVP